MQYKSLEPTESRGEGLKKKYGSNLPKYGNPTGFYVGRMTLGTGGSPGVDMVDATQEVWGGVGLGWGGDDNVPRTCTDGRC